MLVKLLGSVTLVRLIQLPNAAAPMLVTLSGIITFDKPVPPKAALPILLTLFGIMIWVRLMQPLNAESPMLVTGRPLIVSGIVTVPPIPAYSVMVMTPLLIV